jgi:hypothetical protein
MPNAQDELKRLNTMILRTFTPDPPENTVKPGFEIEPIKAPEPEPHDPMDAHWQALIAERDKLKAMSDTAYGAWEECNEQRKELRAEWDKLIERVSELEGALQTIIDGIPRPSEGVTIYRSDGKISKHDKCKHGLFMWEGCDECVSDFARAALSRTSEEA